MQSTQDRLGLLLYAERWRRHCAESERYAQERLRHWEKVKSDPGLQEKGAGPPEEGWEWDTGSYLLHIGWDIGPENEIPAQHVADVMKAVERMIEQNESEMRKYTGSSYDYQRLAQSIPVLKQDLLELHSEFDKVDSGDTLCAWIKAPQRHLRNGPSKDMVAFQWFRWIDVSEEEVFGCWRPPPKEILEHPCERLIPEEDTRKLPVPRDRTEEYERYYVSLASIHDNRLTGSESIAGAIWPAELAESIWFRFTKAQPWGPDKPFLETALKRVKSDLDLRDPGEPADGASKRSEKEAWYWKLYEKTLKIVIEAVLDRCKGS